MASEIRVNQIQNRSGLGTVTFTDTGAVLSGVITARTFIGDGGGLTGVVGSGSGVIVKDGGVLVGTAGTINFGNNVTVSGISAGIVTVSVTGVAYNNNDVDNHLNQSTTTTGQILSWNGADYDWVAQTAAYADSSVDAHLNQSSASTGQILSWNGSDYAWVADQTGGGGSYANSDVDTHLNTSSAGNNEVLSWTGSDYDWVAQTGGTTTFTGLTDTPANFTSQAGKYVRVNSGATALEFVTLAGGGSMNDLSDDTNPQLGGDLDLNSNNISGTGTISASRIVTSTWTLGANGSSDYTFTGPGLTGTVNDPTIYLIRGQSYHFVNNMGAHPFRIQSDPNGSTGTQYNTGVTNNDVSSGTLIFDVPFDAPDVLYYQCTLHPNMGGKIVITAPPKRFTTAASTGSIAAAATQDITIAGCETYALLKIATSHAAWVRLYTDTTSRTNDASRVYTTDPLPGAGVIAEAYSTTSGSNTFKMSPGVIGWNDDGTPSSNIYAKVTNNESGSADVTVTLTIVRMED